jgi:putative MATE family efflux protein
VRARDREIARLAIPAFGALVAEPLYILADTAVVGHLGTPQLAGLAIASSVLLTGYAIFIFLAYGTTAAVARLLGAGDEREAAHLAVQGMWLALLIAAVLVPAGFFGADWLVRVLGASGDVATNAEIYLRISVLGVPAILVTLAGTGYLRGMQDTVTPLMVAVGTNIFNLGFELFLINGVGYGIGASALATVLAQYIGAGVYVTRIGRSVRTRHVSVRPHGSSVRALARTGGPLFVRTAALRGSLTLGIAIAARIGPVEVAAYAIAFELWNFLALALDAIAIAAQAIVGKELGASDADEAVAMSRRMLWIGFVAGAVFGSVVIVFRNALPHIFTDDPAVLALASFLLWYVALMQPFNGLVFVLDGVLIGAGDLRYLAWAMVGAALVFVAGGAVVLELDLGVGWLWAAIVAFMLARLVGLGVRFLSGRWAVTGAVRA